VKKPLTAALAAVTAGAALAVVGPVGAASAATTNYKAARCSVSPDGKARLSVTRWDDTTYRYRRYHLDLNSSYGALIPDYYQKALYFDGVKQTGTNDVYKNVPIYTTHTIKGTWTAPGGVLLTVSCSVRL
jgi:hypothetical protein